MGNAGIHYARRAFLLWWLLSTSSYANRRRRQRRDSAISLQCYHDDVTNFSCFIGLHCRHISKNARLGKSKRISYSFSSLELLLPLEEIILFAKAFCLWIIAFGECFRLQKSATKEGQTAQLFPPSSSSTYGRLQREVHTERFNSEIEVRLRKLNGEADPLVPSFNFNFLNNGIGADSVSWRKAIN